MKITFTKINNQNKLSEAILQLREFKLKININCKEIYSKNSQVAKQNKIASLLESYGRKEINSR